MGLKAAETARKINEAFGDGTVSESTVQFWFKRFHRGDESLKDVKGRGRNALLKLKEVVEAGTRKLQFEN